ncbi:hypothetical protein [Burkholderia sp. IT-111MI5]
MKTVLKRFSLAVALLASLAGGIGVYAVATAPAAHAEPCGNC